MALLETGLWGEHAAELWDLELKMSEKQGMELRIIASDEAEVSALAAANPEKVREREALSAELFEHISTEEGGL